MAKEDEIYDENGVRINYDPNEVRQGRSVGKKIRAVVPLLCILAYLICGLFFKLWGYGALVFLAIPITEITVSAISSTAKKRVMLLTLLLCIILYVGGAFLLTYLGVTYAWLKLLIVFILIPIVSTIIK